MKKVAVLTAGFGLSLALLCGCGTPKVEDVVEKMYEAEVESANINVVFDVAASAEVDGDDYAVDASVEFDIAAAKLNKDPDMHITGSLDYNLADLLEDSYDFDAYVLSKDELYYYYDEDADTWYVTDLGDSGVDVDTDSLEAVQDAAKNLWNKAEIESKTEEISDEECYVLNLTLTGENMEEFLGEAMDAMDMADDWEDAVEELEDEYDVKIADVLNYFPIEITAYASKENGYMMACDVTLGDVDFEGMLEEFDNDLEDELGVAVENIEIEKFEFHVTYSDVNDVEVELDEDIEEEAVDPYDYDWDIDDGDDDTDVDVDVDIIDDPVEEPVDYYEDEAEFYDEETGCIHVSDYWDSTIEVATLYVPTGYEMDYEGSDGSYFGLSDDDWNSIYISSYASGWITDLIYDEIELDKDDYDWADYEYTYYTIDNSDFNGNLVYVIYYKYAYTDDPEYYYEYTTVLLPYTDSWDEDTFISIELPADIVTDTEEGDEILYSMLEEMLADY